MAKIRVMIHLVLGEGSKLSSCSVFTLPWQKKKRPYASSSSDKVMKPSMEMLYSLPAMLMGSFPSASIGFVGQNRDILSLLFLSRSCGPQF